MQDLHFTPVHATFSRDTKDSSACESLHYWNSISLHWTELLLCNMVTERNLKQCESNCLRWRDTVQFGTHVYVMAPTWYMSKKITRCHMPEDSNFHIQYITVYCAQNPLNISECASKIRNFGRLNVLIMCEGYCKLLLTCRRMMCVSAAACSGSVQVLSVDPLSHFHTVRYKFTTHSYVHTT
jgi:hypothetical protein